MIFAEILRKIFSKLKIIPYKVLDRFYISLDKKNVRRTKNILLIPQENKRRGGKYSYAEWAHVIGIFQTLMCIHLDNDTDNNILDVGCGTGLLAIASQPFLGDKGGYVGIDVMKKDIDFCRCHYPSSSFEFIHFEANNPAYAPSQKDRVGWNIDNASFDLVIALSVWTHLNEKDALFYIKEVNRVLKSGGKAIITVFLLDDLYERSLGMRNLKEKGKYHMTPQKQWIFDRPAYNSDMWFCPNWVQVPEEAIGVTKIGLNRLSSEGEMKIIEFYQGNWKEVPGLFFQDILVFQKA